MAAFSTKTVSHLGDRSVNMDACGYAIVNGIGCWCIADGLGAHHRSEVAAQLAVSVALDVFRQRPRVAADLLNEQFRAASRAIQTKQREGREEGNLDLSRIATTLVILIADQSQAIWGHVGDSRLYWFRDTILLRQTEDHSLSQLKASQSEHHGVDLRSDPTRNELYAALDGAEKVKAKISDLVKIEERDSFLLCVDGFWESILETEMAIDLAKAPSVEGWIAYMCQRIADRARKDEDNVSAIAIWVSEVPQQSSYQSSVHSGLRAVRQVTPDNERRTRSWITGWSGGLLLGTVLTLGVIYGVIPQIAPGRQPPGLLEILSGRDYGEPGPTGSTPAMVEADTRRYLELKLDLPSELPKMNKFLIDFPSSKYFPVVKKKIADHEKRIAEATPQRPPEPPPAPRAGLAQFGRLKASPRECVALSYAWKQSTDNERNENWRQLVESGWGRPKDAWSEKTCDFVAASLNAWAFRIVKKEGVEADRLYNDLPADIRNGKDGKKLYSNLTSASQASREKRYHVAYDGYFSVSKRIQERYKPQSRTTDVVDKNGRPVAVPGQDTVKTKEEASTTVPPATSQKQKPPETRESQPKGESSEVRSTEGKPDSSARPNKPVEASESARGGQDVTEEDRRKQSAPTAPTVDAADPQEKLSPSKGGGKDADRKPATDQEKAKPAAAVPEKSDVAK